MQRSLSVCLLMFSLVLVVGTPRAWAQRSGGGGSWLEKLSGPGPFFGPSGFVSFCLDRDEDEDQDEVGGLRFKFPDCNPAKNGVWLNLAVSRLTAGEERRDELDSPDVTLWSFEPSLDFKLVDLWDDAYVEYGFGFGVHHFGGEGFGFSRVSLQPIRIGLVPAQFDRYQIQLRFTTTYFVDGFTAQDFGDPTGTFEEDAEIVFSGLLGVNIVF